MHFVVFLFFYMTKCIIFVIINVQLFSKYMDLKQIESVKSELKEKIDKGDFMTLSKILNVKPNTARARYRRNNTKAVLLLKKIVTSKEKLINKLKEQNKGSLEKHLEDNITTSAPKEAQIFITNPFNGNELELKPSYFKAVFEAAKKELTNE